MLYLENIKKQINIIDYISKFTKLTFNGKEYIGICPLHKGDTDPSLHVNEERQQYYCFGCNSGGDVIDFVEKYYSINFEKAIEKLSIEYNISTIKKPKILSQIRKFTPNKDVVHKPRLYIRENAMDEFPESHKIIEWIEEGISLDVLEKYNVRYDKNKTGIFFPIYDNNGRIISIKRRTLVKNFKDLKINKYIYLNKIGEKDFFFGWCNNIKDIEAQNEIILVEAEKSVMKLESVGITNCVAIGSHSISSEEEKILIRNNFDNIVVAFDSDVLISEINKNFKKIKIYKNCYVMINDGSLVEKEAPIDRGVKTWIDLYKKRMLL